MTRSRSQSASSGRTSGSSSSGSSSSGSSSSSSSGSGSDSSSSDTEASQGSKASRASQRSRRSNTTTQSKVPAKSKLSGTVKNKEPIPLPSSSNVKRSGNVSSAVIPKPSTSQITSGSFKNTKAKVPSITKLTHRTSRKKSIPADSSESETTVTTVTKPVNRVGSKPPTVSIITTSKNSGTVTNLNPINVKKLSSAPSRSHVKSNNNFVSSTTNSSSSANKKKLILKSIFSDNSSEESEPTRSRTATKKPNSIANVKVDPHFSSSKKSTGGGGGESSAVVVPLRSKKKPIASTRQQNEDHTSSSALSGTGGSSNSNSSSSGSSSDSSSASEKKSNAEGGSSPKSASRKRPVTRRRTVKSKTIPTTTMFTQSVVVKSSPQLTHWESDYSASDEHENRVLSRVPTKTSLKPRRTIEDDDELADRERRCPFPTCDSTGHLSGKYPSHSMLSTCPKYQGFSPEECKENADERRIRENERKKVYNITNPHQKRPTKLSHDAKNWVAKLKDLKEKNTKDGLCTEYDMGLWVDALSGAAGKIEEEQSEGIGYRSIAVGKFEMSCWCESPYPEPLCHARRLFICEFCLKPVQSGTVLRRHCAKCVWRHPPGDEIYRKDRLSVWEVDGKTQKSYCQNLCLLAKCFLDHKTLYLDVDPFLFYVMTVVDSQGCHLVGYFSKEKNSFLSYNVSCILTLPPYQRKGFGRLLIDFSYLLTRVEGKVGSPEKPLSDLGLISYRSYWKDAVLRRMCACATKDMVVKDLSIELGVTTGDLISTLQFLGMLKYWKGKHIVLKKQDVLEEYLERVRRRGETKQIDPASLRWRPFQPPVESSS